MRPESRRAPNFLVVAALVGWLVVVVVTYQPINPRLRPSSSRAAGRSISCRLARRTRRFSTAWRRPSSSATSSAS
jgi:hypothetical protein